MAPNTDLLFGPMLMGVFLNCILYGVAVVQAFMYLQNFKRDALWIRCFVLYLLVVETVNAGCDIGLIYEPLVLRWGDQSATVVSPIMLPSDSIVTVLISTPVQLFLAWRVKVMSNSKIIPSVICFFAVISLFGGFATGITVSFINEYAQFHRFEGAPTSWLVASAAADVLITASLVWNLYRRKTGIPVTDDVVNRIIRLTVQTGLITAATAIADVTIFVASTTTINYLFDFPLSKLYTNSVLSTLNARGRWRSISRPSELASISLQGRRRREDSSTHDLESGEMVMSNAVYDITLEDNPSSSSQAKSPHVVLRPETMPNHAEVYPANTGMFATTVAGPFADPLTEGL